jgi:hypothetical protein
MMASVRKHPGIVKSLLGIQPGKMRSFKGKLLLIYICDFHVLSNLLLIYICKLHWNLNTMFICQVNSF